MFSKHNVLSIFIICHSAIVMTSIQAAELTFELPDKRKDCFYETLELNSKAHLEFQVISGGNYDVDVQLFGPSDESVYTGQKKQYDSYHFTVEKAGVYKACFSNEFSTFTHKLVYIDFSSGKEKPLVAGDDKPSVHSQLETSAMAIHESLKVVTDYQTHFRLNEASGRMFAEDLNDRVSLWSVLESVVIVIIGVSEVLVLRSFFPDRKHGTGTSGI
ncbi:hypothetical protein BOX15_Mlig017720g2 [Macrostomum lignano]|uniref:GOLD domain-containing protein n=1 Tax=Macrostomum lignano TaxID=282301 RepID=A0A267DRJ0_9PLAT|nr:hypothetical protein BOX15_Mlig017720g3 [Macrostomum lignano]PAA67531.1 hypothetical protein BOX15_Mlig017720g1 [Macrostomum lignano]PAA89384.1 hypothetical protein BOX15_Mlig017720g2 [Macrostomum lignano]